MTVLHVVQVVHGARLAGRQRSTQGAGHERGGGEETAGEVKQQVCFCTDTVNHPCQSSSCTTRQ